jgi:hypothetical protein
VLLFVEESRGRSSSRFHIAYLRSGASQSSGLPGRVPRREVAQAGREFRSAIPARSSASGPAVHGTARVRARVRADTCNQVREILGSESIRGEKRAPGTQARSIPGELPVLSLGNRNHKKTRMQPISFDEALRWGALGPVVQGRRRTMRSHVGLVDNGAVQVFRGATRGHGR